jgi:plasmid maintenance system antidote protein VapI
MTEREHSMKTLQDIKKERGLTNKTIAQSLQCSTSKVGMMLQGRHIRAISDREIEQLAQALDVTFERCWLAMVASYNQWAGKPLDTLYERSDEMQYRIAQEMKLEQYCEVPRGTSIDGSLVIEASRQITTRKHL